jgi:Ca-activated chloride channel family protein
VQSTSRHLKLRTVGALAALGMVLSSYSVWSLADSSPRERETTGERRPWTERRTEPGTRGASFTRDGTLDVEARLGHSRLDPARDGETFVFVSVRADAGATGKPAQRHLSIVIDRSGSMSGKRLANAIAAARGAVQRLPDGDLVSIIEYSTTARELVAPTVLDDENRNVIAKAIDRLHADGDTCISCALDTAFSTLERRSAAVNRVLLLSDGEATTGVTDVDGLRSIAARLRRNDATITTVGVDVNFNERLMAGIADETNGRHYFVENADGLGRIFERELTGLERTVAKNARLELELASGVELVEVADRAYEGSGRRVSVPLGAFSAGDERTVLARVRVSSGVVGERALVTATLRYDDLTRDSAGEEHGELLATLSRDGSRSAMDPLVEERVTRSATLTTLDQANRLFEAGNAEEARKRVQSSLSAVAARKASAIAAAPAPRKAKVAEEFARQEAALGQASEGFATPPPGADAEREGKAALKRNQAAMGDMRF